MVKLTEISSFISQDFEEIQRTLDHIQLKYNSSLRFFEIFDRSLHNLEAVYADYHLFILWYVALVILGILFLAKVVSLINFCINCWPSLTTFYSDFSEYRRVRGQEDEYRGGCKRQPIHRITFHSKTHLRLKWAKLSLIMNKIEQGGSVT